MLRRVALALCVTVSTVANVGCDPYYAIDRSASCASVTPTAIRSALESEPTVEVMDYEPPGSRGFYCAHAGITANVDFERDPVIVRVCVGSNIPPDEAEIRRWEDSAIHVSERITAACPEVGPRETADWTRPPSIADGPRWMTAFVLTVGLTGWLAAKWSARHPPSGGTRPPD